MCIRELEYGSIMEKCYQVFVLIAKLSNTAHTNTQLLGMWEKSVLTIDYLPRDVGLPAAPSLTEMLQDHPRLVLFDPLRHHVQDVMHHLATQASPSNTRLT